MGCMKCGKKLGKSQTFCDECLEKMAETPVSPDVVVKLPKRPVTPPVKKKRVYRFRYLWNVENELGAMRSKIRWLRFALIVAIIGFLLSVALIFLLLHRQGQLEDLVRILPF